MDASQLVSVRWEVAGSCVCRASGINNRSIFERCALVTTCRRGGRTKQHAMKDVLTCCRSSRQDCFVCGCWARREGSMHLGNCTIHVAGPSPRSSDLSGSVGSGHGFGAPAGLESYLGQNDWLSIQMHDRIWSSRRTAVAAHRLQMTVSVDPAALRSATQHSDVLWLSFPCIPACLYCWFHSQVNWTMKTRMGCW